MDSPDQWLMLIHKSSIRGFGVFNILFSPRVGQCRTDHDVDPTVRGDPEYPHIYDSRYLIEKWIRFNTGMNPMITGK
jgi:hypothetical protein